MGAVMIIGAGGFIGSHLISYFGKRVLPVYKNDLNLFDVVEVRKFLSSIKPEVIVNCVTLAGKKQSNLTDLSYVKNNLLMFNNLYINREFFNRYINIGSGAELNLNLSSYGVSKKIISDFCETTEKFYSLRLFGCFGLGEPDFRLFSSYLKESDDFEFNLQDKLFDNMSVQDFCKILDFYVTEKNPPYKVIDCVYKNKLFVSDQIKTLQKITGKRRPLTLSRGKDYIGCSQNLDSLNLNLAGFKIGLKQYV
jgi:nucleoside-diphosphate-sugar epimerase